MPEADIYRERLCNGAMTWSSSKRVQVRRQKIVFIGLMGRIQSNALEAWMLKATCGQMEPQVEK
jgi:hypothetical protein